MSSFTERLIVSYIDGKRWRVEVPFRYYLSDDMQGEYIEVPKGHVTNFASIPLPFRWALNSLDKRWAKAAVIHDGLVGEFSDQLTINGREATWEEAAEMFGNGCKILKCPQWLRRTMVLLIKLYGKLKGKV